MRGWRPSEFSVDQRVGLEAGDTEEIQRLIEHFPRRLFSQARVIEVTGGGNFRSVNEIAATNLVRNFPDGRLGSLFRPGRRGSHGRWEKRFTAIRHLPAIRRQDYCPSARI